MADSKLDPNKSYGWTGKILRVNLTDKTVSVSPTDPYKEYLGGMGIANKIMYDEVPAGTDPLSPENKIVFAVGPLTATGVPLAGRTTIASLSTYTTDHQVVDAHTGGMIGAAIKKAGWDAIVIEGASDEPVYLKIDDDDIEIKPADQVWGQGTRATTEALSRKEGTDFCVATIGPAGENLLPYACIINSRNHSAGAGAAAVMGSKKLKALVVRGSQPIYVADPQEVADLSDYMLREIVGSNNNHVVPSTQQEWAEYFDKDSRWTAQKGLTWALAEGGPIDTGEPKPGEINTVGYRCMKAFKDEGPEAEKYTIKMDGCHSCPIHCYSDLRVPASAANGGYEITGNTCVPNFPFTNYMIKILGDNTSVEAGSEDALIWDQVFGSTMDDLGLWCNYGQIYRDIAHCYATGLLQKVLPPEEYAEINWEGFKNNDPSMVPPLLAKIAANDSEIAYIGHGPIVWTERWNDPDWWNTPASTLINVRGWPVHHAHECFGQVGLLYNMVFNRDDMIHSAVNFQGCGLPFELKQQIAAEVWGDASAIDPDKNYTPMNEYKANFAWWSIVTDVLHDSLTLCNWVWPMTMSPTKARDYRGDLDLEAKFMKAVTGEDVTTEDLYKMGAKITTLQRANTARGMVGANGQMGTNDFRNVHDVVTEWPFTMDPDIEVFTEGTNKMDKEDFQTALTMMYECFGWDPELGCPTAECLDYYDMPDVKEDLAALGLLPDA
ncbi:aldehyde ferredoxin oxidoreductase [Adlercreutzia equolifaciens]|uniref:aldehyde ferredoxin oxidoreductase n=1 Tax=Adlercreutzia rubneri TaxID=2916441 RepID=UPI001D071AA8|nr:aldehyde ferredoxin oxidoreductase [Adlercreutzia rubneri]MCB6761071.1 aldehyde ferredoxin oxidoreductase [Adlercreutzia equolifaciens]MCB6976734.1 aldehyde ferredoxin oxidoreductase [Adlercreutzia equolifaciens]MDE8684342.1 aldehyde ferredoxin oxidoreductase [Adlercreutzia rubneri]